MKLTFVNDRYFDPSLFLINEDEYFTVHTKLMGQYSILRNIAIVDTIYDIKSIEIPIELNFLRDLIHENFPQINITNTKSMGNIFQETVYDDNLLQKKVIQKFDSWTTSGEYTYFTMMIPVNSVIHINEEGGLVVEKIAYPWDFLNTIQKMLENEVTFSKISCEAKISKTAIVEGPCIIEKGVIIDDFCKIKGPVYIGENSFIGMGSLIRNSILEHDTRIGFNCEIDRSYLAGRDRISHHNVIIDTILGQNVWFGGYSGTENVLANRKKIKYRVGKTLVDTKTDHFGSVIGNNCCIGASVIILPGTRVLPNTQIQAGTIVEP